jgi:hypothetical protein
MKSALFAKEVLLFYSMLPGTLWHCTEHMLGTCYVKTGDLAQMQGLPAPVPDVMGQDLATAWHHLQRRPYVIICAFALCCLTVLV